MAYRKRNKECAARMKLRENQRRAKERMRLEGEASAPESGSIGCRCQLCSENYTVDLITDDALWEQIKPKGKDEGAGLLCGACIMKRIEEANGYRVYHLVSNVKGEPEGASK